MSERLCRIRCRDISAVRGKRQVPLKNHLSPENTVCHTLFHSHWLKNHDFAMEWELPCHSATLLGSHFSAPQTCADGGLCSPVAPHLQREQEQPLLVKLAATRSQLKAEETKGPGMSPYPAHRLHLLGGYTESRSTSQKTRFLKWCMF